MARKPYAHTYTRAGKIFKPHHKLTASGVFTINSGATIEEWSTSISVGAPAGDVTGPSGDAAMLTAATNFWSAIIGSSHCGTHVKLTQVKVAEIDTALVENEPRQTYARPPAVQALSVTGTGGNAMPTEVALAVTLDTQINLKHSGRFYLPGPSAQVDNTSGRAVPTQTLADLVATQVNTLNNAVGAIGGGNTFLTLAEIVALGLWRGVDEQGEPPVLSVIVPSLSAVGVNRRVGQVRVGDVFDVITRRRDKMRENYAVGVAA